MLPECAMRLRHRPRPNLGRFREDFLQFVDPQHTRRKPLSDLKHLLNSLLCLSDVLVIHGSGIELHQRQLPFASNRPSTHTLSAALDPQNNDASRRPKLPSRVLPSPTSLCEPALQII